MSPQQKCPHFMNARVMVASNFALRVSMNVMCACLKLVFGAGKAPQFRYRGIHVPLFVQVGG